MSKKFEISACNSCGERYPSAPAGTIHKCGKCEGGYCVPLDEPSLEDILSASVHKETINSQPMEEWRKQVQPPMTSTYNGRPLTELTHDELVKACEELGRLNERLREHAARSPLHNWTIAPHITAVIEEEDKGHLVVRPDPEPSGMYPVGRGTDIVKALGNFVIAYQQEIGIKIVVADSAMPYEQKRRNEELAKR